MSCRMVTRRLNIFSTSRTDTDAYLHANAFIKLRCIYPRGYANVLVFSTPQYTYLKPTALLSLTAAAAASAPPAPPSPASPPSPSAISRVSSFRFSLMCTNLKASASTATDRHTTVFAVPPGMYRGEVELGYMYDPYMLAVLPIMFPMAMAAERLASGRGKELATHEMMI